MDHKPRQITIIRENKTINKIGIERQKKKKIEI